MAFLRTTDSKKYVEIPYGRTVTIGRSHKADLQIMGDHASSNHAEIKLAEGRNAGTAIVKDVSQNGTGLLRPGQRPHGAAALPGDTGMVVPWGSGLIIPMRKPSAGRTKAQTVEQVILLKPDAASPRRRSSTPRATTSHADAPSYMAELVVLIAT